MDANTAAPSVQWGISFWLWDTFEMGRYYDDHFLRDILTIVESAKQNHTQCQGIHAFCRCWKILYKCMHVAYQSQATRRQCMVSLTVSYAARTPPSWLWCDRRAPFRETPLLTWRIHSYSSCSLTLACSVQWEVVIMAPLLFLGIVLYDNIVYINFAKLTNELLQNLFHHLL